MASESLNPNLDKIRRVAIIGAGVAGLSMAVCLKQMKTAVEEIVVFDPTERSSESSQSGGVIVLSSGAVILDKLGCLEDLKRQAQRIDRIVVTDNGNTLMRLDTNEVAEWMPELLCDQQGQGSPMIFATRWSVLRKTLQEYSYRPSKHLEGLVEYELAGNEEDIRSVKVTHRKNHVFQYLRENELSDGKVTLHFAGGVEESGFDLVIGADGVHSTMRGFTQCAHQTVLDTFPRLAAWLPENERDNQHTGLRVTQCVPPHHKNASESGISPSKSSSVSTKIETLPQPVSEQKQTQTQSAEDDKTFTHALHHYIGSKCHVLTVPVPSSHTDQATTESLVIVYREPHKTLPEKAEDLNATWQSMKSSMTKEILDERLRQGGFPAEHSVHAIVEETARQGGFVADIGVRDNAIPQRSWSSKSGRVVLIGDCAHATSPFLEQGANQAIQDAFCLAGLIAKYNQDQPLTQHVQFRGLIKRKTLYALMVSLALSLLGAMGKSFFDRSIITQRRPTKLQSLVYEFEKTRKFNVCVLTVAARVMGLIQTMSTPVGVFLKCLFFRLLSATGLAAYIFFRPMKPVV